MNYSLILTVARISWDCEQSLSGISVLDHASDKAEYESNSLFD